ncbi:MAG: radical SAM protein [Pseudobdellovibrionaceae bacterium]
MWDFALGNSHTKSIPPVLQIGRSNICNFKCVYCPDHRIGNRVPREKLDQTAWGRLAQLIPRAELLSFHGISEFLLDPDFFSIVETCQQAQNSLSLNTNGSICTDKHIEVLKNYSGYLIMTFSIDAASESTYRRIRGADFWKITENIRTYIKSFSSRRHATWLNASFVVTVSNMHEIVDFVYLSKALGFDSVRFHLLHQYDGLDWKVTTKDGSEFDYVKELPANQAEEYNKQVVLATKAAKVLEIELEIPAPFDLDNGKKS